MTSKCEDCVQENVLTSEDIRYLKGRLHFIESDIRNKMEEMENIKKILEEHEEWVNKSKKNQI